VLVEAGDRQPRTLANAFREAVSTEDRTSNHSIGQRTARALTDHLAQLDRVYETGEARFQAAMPELKIDGIADGSLRELAQWAGELVRHP
jgi:CRISPR system Cascade subunit CasC